MTSSENCAFIGPPVHCFRSESVQFHPRHVQCQLKIQKLPNYLPSLASFHFMYYFTWHTSFLNCTMSGISWLCMNLKLRQRVSATANIYFKRFYLRFALVPKINELQNVFIFIFSICCTGLTGLFRNNFSEFEPSLVGATCVLMASMVEECTVKVDEILRLLENASMKTLIFTRILILSSFFASPLAFSFRSYSCLASEFATL